MSADSVDLLPVLLSLDVTAGLVKQSALATWGGPGAFTADVLNASNTSPIVITVAAGSLGALPPREERVYHVVIANVGGNSAANKIDPVTLRNEAWYAIVTSEETDAAITLELYDVDNNTGRLVPSVGNGAYTSHGTVSKALVDGRILVGAEHITESSTAPRIVMVPKRVTFEGPDAASSWTAAAITEDEPEREQLAPPLRTEIIWYEVHVWGKAQGTTAFAPTARIYQQVIRSAQDRCAGVYELGPGDYLDQHDGALQRVKYGHEFVFQLGLAAPIERDAVEYAPEGTVIESTLSMKINGGEPEEV